MVRSLHYLLSLNTGNTTHAPSKTKKSNRKCYKCGLKGHEAGSCTATVDGRITNVNSDTAIASSTDCKTLSGKAKCQPIGPTVVWVPKNI